MKPSALLLLILALGFLALPEVQAEGPSPSLGRLLKATVPDYESATGIPMLRAGPSGSVAEKFLRLQESVKKITNERLPVYIDPAVASRHVPGKEEERLGAPLLDVSLEDVLKLMCSQLELKYELTASGILISGQ